MPNKRKIEMTGTPVPMMCQLRDQMTHDQEEKMELAAIARLNKLELLGVNFEHVKPTFLFHETKLPFHFQYIRR